MSKLSESFVSPYENFTTLKIIPKSTLHHNARLQVEISRAFYIATAVLYDGLTEHLISPDAIGASDEKKHTRA